MNLPDHTQEHIDHLYSETQQYRIGSRATFGDGDDYTLVALEIHRRTIQPVYVADTFATDTQFAVLNDEDETAGLDPAPDDSARALAARNWAVGRREQFSQYGATDIIWDNPTSPAQVREVLQFGDTDRAWRIADHAQRKAALERALRIARVVWSAGENQSAAARLLGLDQSRVSRAVDAANRATDSLGA